MIKFFFNRTQINQQYLTNLQGKPSSTDRLHHKSSSPIKKPPPTSVHAFPQRPIQAAKSAIKVQTRPPPFHHPTTTTIVQKKCHFPPIDFKFNRRRPEIAFPFPSRGEATPRVRRWSPRSGLFLTSSMREGQRKNPIIQSIIFFACLPSPYRLWWSPVSVFGLRRNFAFLGICGGIFPPHQREVAARARKKCFLIWKLNLKFYLWN